MLEFVGKIGDAQEMSFGNGCHWVSTYIHEIFHALGSFHTQQRSDRDQHVNIVFDNVVENAKSNFKLSSNPICGCYDCNSIMHYSQTAFSKNGLKTIVPIDTDKCSFSVGYTDKVCFVFVLLAIHIYYIYCIFIEINSK